MITVKEIIIKGLKEIGCDGLAYDECGCGIDDLCPCSEIHHDCEAAKLTKGNERCNECSVSQDCKDKQCYVTQDVALESQVTRLRELCGELWRYVEQTSDRSKAVLIVEQRLKKEGVLL